MIWPKYFKWFRMDGWEWKSELCLEAVNIIYNCIYISNILFSLEEFQIFHTIIIDVPLTYQVYVYYSTHVNMLL